MEIHFIDGDTPLGMVPRVCPACMQRIFFETHQEPKSIHDLTGVPERFHELVRERKACANTFRIYPDNVSMARALECRLHALVDTIDTDLLDRIGEKLFDDRDHLIQRFYDAEGKAAFFNLSLGVVTVAAYVDLKIGSKFFEEDAFSLALLTIKEGCPLKECPAYDDHRKGPDP